MSYDAMGFTESDVALRLKDIVAGHPCEERLVEVIETADEIAAATDYQMPWESAIWLASRRQS
jgi:hypothetical protein